MARSTRPQGVSISRFATEYPDEKHGVSLSLKIRVSVV